MTTRERAEALLGQFAALRTRMQARRLQRSLLIIAVGAFVIATVVGLRNLPTAPEPVRWQLLLLAVLTTPIGVGFNAAEYQFCARLIGRRVGIIPAARVAVLGSAFNLLPVPGAVLVRTQALKEAGSGYKRAIGTAAVTGIAYMATGFGAAAIPLVPSHPGWAAAFFALAALFVALTVLGVRLYVRRRVALETLLVFAIEMGSVLIKSVAIVVVGRAIGYDVTFGDALVVNLSIVVTAAIGIFPGGLGLRELLAGALSPLTGLAASVALTITSFARIIGLALLAVMAFGLGVRRGGNAVVAVDENDEPEVVLPPAEFG